MNAATNEMLKDKIEDVLKTLTYREREIIKLRYGLGDGYTYTLEEVGRIFKVTRERVRQIEAKAVRKLQHPAIHHALSRCDAMRRFAFFFLARSVGIALRACRAFPDPDSVRQMPVRVVVIGAGFAGAAVAVALLPAARGALGRPRRALRLLRTRHRVCDARLPASAQRAGRQHERVGRGTRRPGRVGGPARARRRARRLPAALGLRRLCRGRPGRRRRRTRRVTGEAVRIERGDVVLADGERIAGDVVVLAVGLGAPPVLPALAAIEGHPGYVPDPSNSAR